MKELKFKTAGYSLTNDLTVNPGMIRCGKIKNGVSFEHDRKGGWVLSFKDLEKIYLAAKQYRSESESEKQ